METMTVVDNRKNGGAKIKEIWSKIKRVKHIEVILAAIVIVAVLAVYFIGNASGGTKKAAYSETVLTSSDATEQKLCSILSEIEGAGNVQVMITYVSSTEIVTANTSTTSIDKTSANDRTSESRNETVSPVLITQSGTSTPLIVKEILPEVRGVIVIAGGANDIKVRLNLLNAVCTVLAVDAGKVEIFTKNKT